MDEVKKKIVITYGTYDMFHVGHLNLLRRAKALGDYLIVGVTSEDYDRSRGKLNVSESTKKRVSAIKALDFVDQVVVEKHKHQKQADIKKYKADIFAIGDDWKGKFDYLNEYCHVEYLPRTEGISSTMLRADQLKTIRLGIVGTGRIAKRFAKESSFVSTVEIHAVMSRNIENVNAFAKEYGIHYGFTSLQELLDTNVDAVYIASPHENHFEQIKMSLLANKHVLCEKPIVLNKKELKELIEIATEKNLILMEAIKTAYFPAFNKVLDQIKQGVIGEVQEVRATFTKLVTDHNQREWEMPNGGAFNELASYPLLLLQKVLGRPKNVKFYSKMVDGVDTYTTILTEYSNERIGIATVAIGAKSEGSAIISGKHGYIYIPAPWWLTKDFYIRFEDPSKEISFHFDLEGDGLRYEIAEFITQIQRDKNKSKRLALKDIKAINKIVHKFNNDREFKI